MTDFGSRHKTSHQDGGGDEIDATGLVGRVDYVDRGDPAAADWTKGDLSTDGAWHDLDCSAIVPGGAKAILLSISLLDNEAGIYLKLREKGDTNYPSDFTIKTQVANIAINGQAIITCDVNRFIQYYATNTDWQNISITVIGWLI